MGCSEAQNAADDGACWQAARLATSAAIAIERICVMVAPCGLDAGLVGACRGIDVRGLLIRPGDRCTLATTTQIDPRDEASEQGKACEDGDDRGHGGVASSRANLASRCAPSSSSMTAALRID